MPRSGWALAALLAAVLCIAPARFALAQDFEAPPIPSLVEEPTGEGQESPEYYGGTPVEPPAMEEILTPGFDVYDEGTAEAVTATGGVYWSLQFDAIFLRRSEQTVLPLVDGATPYGAQNLDVPFKFGPRVSLIGSNLYGQWQAEFTYFSVDGWLTQRTSDAATTLLTTPAINFGARPVTSAYRESLYSTEFNLRRQFWNSLTMISGFRMIELQSDLFTDLVGSSHHVNANNHLYGYQLGGDWRFFSGYHLDLSTWLKAGVYGNAADQSTDIVNVGGAVPNFGVAGGRAAFVGELGVAGAYRWNGWLAARAGYQLLWFDGVAMAPDQIPVSNVATGVAALDTSKTLLYHGGFMGLELTW